MSNKDRHVWSREDNERALMGLINGESYTSVAAEIGVSERSMKMKYSNLRHVLKGEGHLDQASKDAKAVVLDLASSIVNRLT